LDPRAKGVENTRIHLRSRPLDLHDQRARSLGIEKRHVEL
jgi:hypothetical protein